MLSRRDRSPGSIVSITLRTLLVELTMSSSSSSSSSFFSSAAGAADSAAASVAAGAATAKASGLARYSLI